MNIRFLKRLAMAGAITTSVALLLGTGVGQAATLGQGPQFFTPGVNQFRATGSETTYYVMTAVGSLYSQSSIYGCTLSSTDFKSCVTTADGSATDTLDDYSRNEFINGEGIGTGNGIGQLCGSKPTGGLTVDFARGSRAPNAGDGCPSAVALEFARDSVVGVVFPFHNKAAVACTGTCSATQVGPVSAGWRPGDPLGGPYSGVALTGLDNTTQVPGSGHSLAFEIYCDTTTSFKINDWGQLTDKTDDPANPGHSKGSEGIGTPIGAPIYIPAVNTGSGTYSTWKSYVGCDPNTKNTDAKIVQENDAPQLTDIANADNPSDSIAAANQVAESLYYISYGVSQWRPYTYSSGGVSGKLTKINGLSASPALELSKTIATFRGLYNIYKSGSVRASVAGFLNYLCDTDPGKANHGTDLTTGKNYSDELTNTISTQFVFPRVPCAVDGSGNSIPPITAAQVTDLNS
jgi:hypothetical protein